MGIYSMEKITAVANDKIKYAVRLSSSGSFRRENREFFLEGARLCSDAAGCGINIAKAFFTRDALDKYNDYIDIIISKCNECFEIGNDVAKKIGDTQSTQGVFCICEIPDEDSVKLNPLGRYLALENVQDPSNFGAISRSAEAIGLDGLIVSGGCDIYNPKALRAAMGSSLRLPVITADNLPEFLKEAKSKGIKTYASVPLNSATDIRNISREGGIICCIGNEGNGLTEETKAACDELITIPMQGRAESFNASAAAAIIAWELKR